VLFVRPSLFINILDICFASAKKVIICLGFFLFSSRSVQKAVDEFYQIFRRARHYDSRSEVIM